MMMRDERPYAPCSDRTSSIDAVGRGLFAQSIENEKRRALIPWVTSSGRANRNTPISTKLPREETVETTVSVVRERVPPVSSRENRSSETCQDARKEHSDLYSRTWKPRTLPSNRARPFCQPHALLEK